MNDPDSAPVSNSPMTMSRLAACATFPLALAPPRARAATAAAFTIDSVPRKAKYKPPLDRLKH